jgi:hypothetical protein
MSQETASKFIGRAVVVDPSTGEDTEYSAYVCILLTGPTGIPSVTVCEARTLDELLAKLRASDLNAHFARAKITYEPPRALWPINHSSARQRYEALPYAELNRAQTVLSGR